MSFIHKFLGFALLLFSLSTQARIEGGTGGSLIGNGGNTLLCKAGGDHRFEGYFTLDYILDFKTSGPFSKLAPITDWNQSKLRILAQLNRLNPVLAKNFENFAESILKNEITNSRLWEAADLSQVIIHDQEITKLLPSNCYLSDGKTLDIHQTVIRSYQDDYVRYLYEKKILDLQATSAPIQFSFFMVHEWLWDLTDNVRAIRALNWIIHSEDFENMRELNTFFERNRFFSRNLPVCNRTTEVRRAIEKSLSQDCAKIADADLATIETLDLSGIGPDYTFRPGDFGHLFGLKEINFTGTNLLFDQLTPYSFTDLVNLQRLKVSNSFTAAIPLHLFEGPRTFVLVKE